MLLGLAYRINVPAVLVCGVASLALGFLWYGPLFGKAWAGYTGWTEEKIKTIPAKRMAGTYLLTFLAALVTAFFLDVLTWGLGTSGVREGISLGLMTGIAFSAMAFATTHLFEHKPIALWLIVSGYQVSYQVAAALIIVLLR
jgi:hypothetical protein